MHSVITLQPGVDPKRQVLFDPSVVTAQPTESVPSAPGVPWMPVPLNETGLEYLKDLEMIQINQTKESVGILTTWQLENKYVLRNGNGEQCYYGLERSDECERDCCSSYREFKIHIVDCFTKVSIYSNYRNPISQKPNLPGSAIHPDAMVLD
uniref:Phospholipid scramblase n=1 Tax=Caenorhabditis tropicalis TaxID=1561998 RepID=A0A1I7TU49_9PELO